MTNEKIVEIAHAVFGDEGCKNNSQCGHKHYCEELQAAAKAGIEACVKELIAAAATYSNRTQYGEVESNALRYEADRIAFVFGLDKKAGT